jgi:hypothetical protein
LPIVNDIIVHFLLRRIFQPLSIQSLVVAICIATYNRMFYMSFALIIFLLIQLKLCMITKKEALCVKLYP